MKKDNTTPMAAGLCDKEINNTIPYFYIGGNIGPQMLDIMKLGDKFLTIVPREHCV